MKKRIFSLFMVFTLCFVNVNQVYADTGTLIIAGGSVAGVTAGAIAGPAVVAVFCAMMAFGMNVELTQASEEAGMTKTQFLKNKIQEYCNEAQISANTFNNYILDQANVFQNGAISLTDRAGQFIKTFCNWLFESDYVSDTAIVSTVTIKNIECPVFQRGDIKNLCKIGNGQVYSEYETGDVPFALVACKQANGELHIYAFRSTYENQYRIDTTFNGQMVQTSQYTDYNYYNVYAGRILNVEYSGVNSIEIPIYEGNFSDFCNGIESVDFSGNSTGDTVTGNQDIYDVNSNVLTPTQDQTIVINPNITIPVPADKDVTIDINEYLDIIQDMIDGVAEDIITAIDDVTDVPITIEFDPTQDWDPTIEKEDDTDLPPDDEKTPVIKDDIIPHDFDPEPLKFDLKGIFPFCIPWDVKDMLSKLSADPVAPSYTVNWMVPIVNERLIFTVDLTPFNGVAQVCRNMELLAFCIGLAVVTRQLFLRG